MWASERTKGEFGCLARLGDDRRSALARAASGASQAATAARAPGHFLSRGEDAPMLHSITVYSAFPLHIPLPPPSGSLSPPIPHPQPPLIRLARSREARSRLVLVGIELGQLQVILAIKPIRSEGASPLACRMDALRVCLWPFLVLLDLCVAVHIRQQLQTDASAEAHARHNCNALDESEAGGDSRLSC